MDEKSSVEETKKWRWLALLWGILPVIGWVAMIVGAIIKKTDRVSWAIFAASMIAIVAGGMVSDAISPSESSQSEEVVTITTSPAAPANAARNTDAPANQSAESAGNQASESQSEAKMASAALKDQIENARENYQAALEIDDYRGMCFAGADFLIKREELERMTMVSGSASDEQYLKHWEDSGSRKALESLYSAPPSCLSEGIVTLDELTQIFGDSVPLIGGTIANNVVRATATPYIEPLTYHHERFETARKNFIASSDILSASPNVSNTRASCLAGLKLAVAIRDMAQSTHPSDQVISATQLVADLRYQVGGATTICMLNDYITDEEFAEITK